MASPEQCFKKIQVSTKIRVLPLKLLVKLPQKISPGISIVERATNLAGERLTLRA